MFLFDTLNQTNSHRDEKKKRTLPIVWVFSQTMPQSVVLDVWVIDRYVHDLFAVQI